MTGNCTLIYDHLGPASNEYAVTLEFEAGQLVTITYESNSIKWDQYEPNVLTTASRTINSKFYLGLFGMITIALLRLRKYVLTTK